jgi:Zn-dependent protease with chaperone function
VRLDRANRMFAALVTLGSLLAGYVIWGVVASVLGPLLMTRVSEDGWGALSSVSLVPVLLLCGLLLASAGRGARELATQLVASRRLVLRTGRLGLPQPDRLIASSAAAGLHGRIVLVDDRARFSFVYGVLSPRVALSPGLLERVSDGELRAALEHERYHVANLDPLKTIAVRVITRTFFFIPALDGLAASYAADRELAADRRSIVLCGARQLAGALLHAVAGPDWGEADVAVPLAAQAHFATRVRQLETGAAPPFSASTLTRAGLAALAAILVLTIGMAGAAIVGSASAYDHASLLRFIGTAVADGLTCAGPCTAAALVICGLITLRQRTGK